MAHLPADGVWGTFEGAGATSGPVGTRTCDGCTCGQLGLRSLQTLHAVPRIHGRVPSSSLFAPRRYPEPCLSRQAVV
eukprot:5945930-Prymnesium_polylepis.1